MNYSTELRQVVYSVLRTQVQFGVYRYGEKLPTIEETSEQFHVSIDTARSAYLRLKDEGYITLSKNVGATVKVKYGNLETEGFMQDFFAARKAAMADLGSAMRALFSNAQWIGVKHASKETLRAMEQLHEKDTAAAPYAMLEHLNQKYSALGNAQLMRLIWQIFTFLYAPFFSVKENLKYFEGTSGYLPHILSLCRDQDWTALRPAMDRSIDRLILSLTRFYEARITTPSPEKEIAFTWCSYKKSQLCYSLAMDLLISINRGIYPVGSLLPSQKELAVQKGLSVSTVRRAFELLDSVGAIKSTRYIGTQVLPFDKATENSNFTKPVLQRRLVDMAESLQIFVLSCKDVSFQMLSFLDAGSLEKLCGGLKEHKQWRRGETLSYFVLDIIAKHAPYQAIRIIYSELLRQNFWGYALRGMRGSQETINAVYDPYYDALIDSLEKADFLQFSSNLEELMFYELCSGIDLLSRLGIPGTENILIPDKITN